jgi:hypothetical protein
MPIENGEEPSAGAKNPLRLYYALIRKFAFSFLAFAVSRLDSEFHD